MTRHLFRTVIAFGLAMLLGQSPLSAQTGQIFGEIVGKVVDDAGGVLPGVTVSLSGPAIMGVRSAVTNRKGSIGSPASTPGRIR